MYGYATRHPMVALRLDSVTRACPPPTQPFAPLCPPPPNEKVWLRHCLVMKIEVSLACNLASRAGKFSDW